MPLSKEERDALPAEHFAVPGKRKLPIHDATHVRLAWDMVNRTGGLSDIERSHARTRILQRAKELGIDTAGWEKKLQHVTEIVLHMEAMAVVLPDVDDHPNRMPFEGILTRVDQPSDEAPAGSGGKRTYLPRAVAEAALPSLMCMGVDFTPGLDGHDARSKIGLITAGTIEGNGVKIKGFFYAADFPQECARIKAEKEDLGFSYEIRAQTRDDGDLLQIVSGVFTGAAVLRKDKAAYHSTSLAAHAAGDIDMTPEELKKLLADAVGPIATQLDTLGKEVTALKAKGDPLQASKAMRELVAPHATALRNCAAGMEAAGIGLHSERGHVRVLHHMAASMEADAARGQLPHIYRDHDWSFSHGAAEVRSQDAPKIGDDPAVKKITEELGMLGTKIADLSAKAFQAAAAPERKTLSGEGLQLLSKAGLKPDATNGKVKTNDLDAAAEKAGLRREESIALKLALNQAGMLEAA